jgi:mono/diheme cytochrome c family protein
MDMIEQGIKAATWIAVAGLLSVVASAGQSGKARVPYGRESVARGRVTYLQNCQDCHGDDGKAQGSAIAVAPDLTDPAVWKFSTTDDTIFANIRNGAGDNMPPFCPLGPGLKDEQIWDLVNYIRSIGPEAKRPAP